MGGALLQRLDRDTQRFAFKASSVVVNGQVRDIFKSPITDNGKRSKAGRLKLVYNDRGILETIGSHDSGKDILQLVYENGEIFNSPTFKEIRERAELKTKIEEPVW
jgi:nicotinamide phosphoribosyltransferase